MSDTGTTTPPVGPGSTTFTPGDIDTFMEGQGAYPATQTFTANRTGSVKNDVESRMSVPGAVTVPIYVSPKIPTPAGEQKLSRAEAADYLEAMLFDPDFVPPTAGLVVRGGEIVLSAGAMALTRASAAKGAVATVTGAVRGAVRGAAKGAVKGMAGGATAKAALRVAPLYALLLELGGDTNQFAQEDARADWVDKIAALLPDRALYPTVLTNLERRPLYAAVVDASQGGKYEVEVGGNQFNTQEVAWTTQALKAENDAERASAEVLAASSGVVDTGKGEVAKWVEQTAQQWRANPGKMGQSPTSVLNADILMPGFAKSQMTGGTFRTDPVRIAETETGEIVPAGIPEPEPPVVVNADGSVTPTASAVDVGFDPDSVVVDEAPGDNVPTWNAVDLQNIVEQYREDINAGLGDLGALVDVETPQYLTENGEFIIDESGRKATGQAYGPAGIQVQTPHPGGGRALGVTEALNYLHDLPRDQVVAMQKMMERGGYYNIGDGGKRVGYEQGYAWDAATGQAWKALLTDSFKQNKPADQLVKERAAAVEAEGRRALAVGTNATDYSGSTFRFNQQKESLQGQLPELGVKGMNAAAEEYLGRPLSNPEKVELFEFMHAKRTAEVDRVGSLTRHDLASAGEGGLTTSLNEGGFDDAALTEKAGEMNKEKDWRARLDSAHNVVLKRFASYDVDKGERPPVVAGFKLSEG